MHTHTPQKIIKYMYTFTLYLCNTKIHLYIHKSYHDDDDDDDEEEEEEEEDALPLWCTDGPSPRPGRR